MLRTTGIATLRQEVMDHAFVLHVWIMDAVTTQLRSSLPKFLAADRSIPNAVLKAPLQKNLHRNVRQKYANCKSCRLVTLQSLKCVSYGLRLLLHPAASCVNRPDANSLSRIFSTSLMQAASVNYMQ